MRYSLYLGLNSILTEGKVYVLFVKKILVQMTLHALYITRQLDACRCVLTGSQHESYTTKPYEHSSDENNLPHPFSPTISLRTGVTRVM